MQSHPMTRQGVLRLLAGAGLAALLPPLTACAAAGNAANALRTITLSQAKLNELVAKRFPYTRNFSGLADLSLQSPRLRLLPQDNRLGTALDLVVAERLTGSRYSGGIDLDYGLRFDDQEGAIRMTDVKVNRIAVDQVPPAQRQLISQYAPRAAETLLSNMVLYRIPDEYLSMARNLGWVVSTLRVQPDGLRIELGPQGAR
ncbi:MAG: DUF1439 domain-containing protein [Ottowia sp.]|nr:DUF1439 domain-containing protein [Ottowia sp.]